MASGAVGHATNMSSPRHRREIPLRLESREFTVTVPPPTPSDGASSNLWGGSMQTGHRRRRDRKPYLVLLGVAQPLRHQSRCVQTSSVVPSFVAANPRPIVSPKIERGNSGAETTGKRGLVHRACADGLHRSEAEGLERRSPAETMPHLWQHPIRLESRGVYGSHRPSDRTEGVSSPSRIQSHAYDANSM